MEIRSLRSVLWLIVLFAGVLIGPTLMAQAINAGDLPASGAADTQEWGFSVVWAFLTSSFLEWLKRHPQIALVSERTAFGVQRGLGVLMSIATALGIHVAFDATAGVLTITGLLLPSIWQLGTESLRQWVFSELIYRTAVKNYRREFITGELLEGGVR